MATGTICIKNFVKFGHAVFKLCEQTDRQTDRQTDMLIAFASLLGVK